MNNELTIQHLLPAVNDRKIVEDKLRSSTFIGIDFGTSTTVVSYTVFKDDFTPIQTDVIPIRQLNLDGSYTDHYLIPSCIAWYEDKLFIGETAKRLKSKLSYGKNLWYSFKMKIGTDNGPIYYNTELPKGHSVATIENPLDATKVFFAYLKQEIDNYIQKKDLPQSTFFSISIPASFEANQRKDIKEALDFAGIPFQDSLFIDEPNAAFLSYLIEANSKNIKSYSIPLDSPLHILIFDFGAGTCDISILEIGRKSDRLYSKNIAISKFEELGGDDIDRQIVKDILFPQLLKQNNLHSDDIRKPEYTKIILPKLQPIAEYLKIQICKIVAQNMVGRSLPPLALSDKEMKIEIQIPIQLTQCELLFTNPSITYKEFNGIVKKITQIVSGYNYLSKAEDLKSIYTVIQSATKKANIGKDYIDLVLLIGGSSYNPYIQKSLREYFDQAEVEIPRDLQAHVSTGTAINSFLQNGMGIDMIRPIISEPILIILQNDVPKIVIKEGTEIPCKNIVIDDLHPQKDNQRQIEIPICVSNKGKILTVAKIQSKDGFRKTDIIRLECSVSKDKLIHFKAFVKDVEMEVEPLNPFANTALSTEEIAEKQLLKEINEQAKNNQGRPPVKYLKRLVEFYVRMGKHLKAAETYESIQLIEPWTKYETFICYHYSNAGMDKLSDKWAEIAYDKNPHDTNAYNLALTKKRQGDINAYTKLMEEAIDKDSIVACLVYGEYLLHRNKERGMKLLQKAFNFWYNQFQNRILNENDYSRLIKVATLTNRLEIAEQVRARKSQLSCNNQIKWYNAENLISDENTYLPNEN